MTLANTAENQKYNLETHRFGMWIFLAMETLFFSAVFMMYFAERSRFPGAFAYGSHHLDLWLGTLNTGILLTSSWAVAAAVYASEKGKAYLASKLLITAAGMGLMFLIVKGFEFHSDIQHVLFPAINFTQPPGAPAELQLFFSLYVFTVTLHALHLIVGMIWLSVLAILIRKNAPGISRWHVRVDIAALYWHFIDLVWIFIFPLYYLVGSHR